MKTRRSTTTIALMVALGSMATSAPAAVTDTPGNAAVRGSGGAVASPIQVADMGMGDLGPQLGGMQDDMVLNDPGKLPREPDMVIEDRAKLPAEPDMVIENRAKIPAEANMVVDDPGRLPAEPNMDIEQPQDLDADDDID